MTILDQILEDTRARVARARDRVGLAALRDMAYYAGPTLPFARGLSARRPAVIAELKKASPSKGIIRLDFDVRDLARQYKRGGAAAISVLTEPTFFKGSLDYLAAVRASVDVPLLRKDFIVDAYQLHEARAYGADAVLLIAAALEAPRLMELHAEAASLGLACLVEVHSAEELDGLDLDAISMIGVNNRDLRTFKVNLNRTLDVAGALPPHVVRISESGLHAAEDLAYLHRAGVGAFLIGESFMRSRSPGVQLGALLAAVRGMLDDDAPTLRLVS